MNIADYSDCISAENSHHLHFAEQRLEPPFSILLITVHILFCYRLGRIH